MWLLYFGLLTLPYLYCFPGWNNLHFSSWIKPINYFFEQWWLVESLQARLQTVGGKLLNRGLSIFASTYDLIQQGVQKGFWCWDKYMADPPYRLQNSTFSVSSESASNFQHFLHSAGKKIPHLIPFCKVFTCKKIWKKSHFLADSSIWNRSQESCFWFMLNCTLNTEQYSRPFFILFTLHLLHIHTYRIYTHPPTLISKILYPPVPNIQLTHTFHPEKHPHLMYNFRVQHLFLDMLCPFPSIGPPYYVINPDFSCSNSSCFCCRVTFSIILYLACT